MTPELAKVLSEAKVNEDLLKIMRDVYSRFTPEELGAVIAKIRAEIVIERLDTDIDTAIAELQAKKSRRLKAEKA